MAFLVWLLVQLLSSEPKVERSQLAPRTPARAAVTITGTEICREIEAAGNGDRGKTQRCRYEAPDKLYILTITGDYGEDDLSVIVLLLQELARLDAAANTGAERVRIVRPEKDAAFVGSTTVTLAAARRCLQAQDRVCFISLVSKPD